MDWCEECDHVCGEADIMRTGEAGAHGRKCHSGRMNLYFLWGGGRLLHDKMLFPELLQDVNCSGEQKRREKDKEKEEEFNKMED